MEHEKGCTRISKCGGFEADKGSATALAAPATMCDTPGSGRCCSCEDYNGSVTAHAPQKVSDTRGLPKRGVCEA
jgi:hypothetical protein